jgi:hypothetical protein
MLLYLSQQFYILSSVYVTTDSYEMRMPASPISTNVFAVQ